MDASQRKVVYAHIKSHESGITSMEAFDYGITRLSANIESVPCSCKNRYGHTTNYVRYVYRGESKNA